MKTLREMSAAGAQADRSRQSRPRPPPSRSWPPPRRGATGPRSLSRSCAGPRRPSASGRSPRPPRRPSDAESKVEAAESRADAIELQAQREVEEAKAGVRTEIDRRVEEARNRIQADADKRVAEAEQRAAESEAAAEAAHETAIRLETEIEKRVMEGTEEVRREAEESVRRLVEKVEREAEESRPRPRRGPAPGRVRADQAAGPAPRGAGPRRDRGRDPRQRQQRPARGPGGRRGRRPDLAAQRRPETAVAAPATAPTSPARTGAHGARPDNLARMREVRIRDTLSGALQTIDPDHEVGIYACGPTVYSRIHIGNARPFVVFSLFARFLRSEGYKTRLVVNVTDINDKIYSAAARAGEGSAAFAEADDRRLRRGHRPARGRAARRRAEGDRDRRRDRRADRRADRGRPRLRVGRRRLLPRPQLPRLRQALQPPPRGHGPGRGGGRRRA